jgi:hypothetical protein
VCDALTVTDDHVIDFVNECVLDVDNVTDGGDDDNDNDGVCVTEGVVEQPAKQDFVGVQEREQVQLVETVGEIEVDSDVADVLKLKLCDPEGVAELEWEYVFVSDALNDALLLEHDTEGVLDVLCDCLMENEVDREEVSVNEDNVNDILGEIE